MPRLKHPAILAALLSALAVTALYLGFDAASPDGGRWLRALRDVLPFLSNNDPTPLPSTGEDTHQTNSDAAPAITALPDAPSHRDTRLPFALHTLEGIGGEGIHRAVRRKSVWFPVYSPGQAGAEAAPDEAEAAAVPLYITSGTPPRSPVNTPVSYLFEAIGGTPPYQWRMTLEAAGFSIDPVTGLFTGSSETPLTAALAIHVSDSAGAEDSALYTLRIGEDDPLTITTTELPAGTPGAAYHAALAASGGVPPLVWSVEDTLPEGLLLDSESGVISGQVATGLDQEILARVTDSTGVEAERAFALSFASSIEIPTPARLQPAAPGSAYQLAFEAAGGIAPYQWSIVRGDLPFNPSGSPWELTPEGVLSGAAAATDSHHRFILEVRDSAGSSAQKTFHLPIRRALVVVPSREKAGLAWRPREIAQAFGSPARVVTITRSLSPDGAAPVVVYQGRGSNHVDRGLATGATYYYTLHAHVGGAPVPFATTSVTILPFTKGRGIPGQLADPHADTVRLFRPLSGGGYGSAFVPANVTGPPDGRGTFSPAADPAHVLSLHARAGSPGSGLDAHGGAIILAFEDNIVESAPGEDFTVFENVFFINGDANRRFMEPAIISVALFEDEWHRFPIDIVPPAGASSTPVTMDPFYYNRGFAGRNATTGGDPTDPRQSGGDSFDLDDLKIPGLTWIRYIKIQSTGHNVLRDDFGGHPVLHTDTLGALDGAGSSGFDLDAVTAVHY